MPVSVKTAVYEGPLEVLLELIEKRKLLINDISLAQVADDYIARVKALPELPLGETAEFVSLAATLLLIKSRSLLPSLALSEEEAGDIKELEYRLALYQLIKEASRELGKSDFPKLYGGNAPEPEPIFVPDPAITVSELLHAAQTLIAGFPQFIELPKVAVKKIMSLEEMIERLSARVSTAFRTSFREFTGKKEKAEVIVGFLALLELIKQGILKAEQGEQHGDIVLEPHSVSTPTYGV